MLTSPFSKRNVAYVCRKLYKLRLSPSLS